jgi:hypothetical protein
MARRLYKTTIVIWSEFDGDDLDVELDDLARDAMTGESYCSKQTSELIEDPTKDPDWDGTEFFDAKED